MEARVLAEELLNFELKVDEKANETYGAFKVGTHDDLVSGLGLGIMAAQRRGHVPFAWYRSNPDFGSQVLGAVGLDTQTDAERRARRRAQAPMTWDEVLARRAEAR
jgi:hypothetical protein